MIEELFTVQQYRAALAEREARIVELERQRDEQSQFWAADIAALQEAEATIERLRRACDARREEFYTILITIGGRLYTQGTGAKWQMDLLSFVRDERTRLEREHADAMR